MSIRKTIPLPFAPAARRAAPRRNARCRPSCLSQLYLSFVAHCPSLHASGIGANRTPNDGRRAYPVLSSQQRADDQIAGETAGRRSLVRRTETRRTETKRIPRDEQIRFVRHYYCRYAYIVYCCFAVIH